MEVQARALCFNPDEDAPVLQLCRVTKPSTVQAGNILVRMVLRPVHPLDLTLVRKTYVINFEDGEKPSRIVPGLEGLGIIELVGEGVENVKKGDRVVPILFWKSLIGKGQGSWQDYIEVSEQDVVKVPDEVSDDTAAQFLINPWTAYCIIQDLDVPKGGYIFQNAAGSVLGRLIIQMSKHLGIKTVNIVRREELKDELKALGADEVFNVNKEDVVKKVKEVTNGEGAWGSIDMLGGTQTRLAAACVRNGGRVFSIGFLESTDLTISKDDLWRDIKLSLWGLIKWRGDNQNVAQTLMEMFKAGIIDVPCGKRFSFEDYEKAIEESEKPGRGGKVFLAS